jgi:Zn-dependent protease/predicted transcriptional regulator
MLSSITIGEILGIPLRINVSWFLILILVIISLAIGYFPSEYPNWEVSTYWTVGVFTTLLFFSSVLLHEFAHSIIAIKQGVPVISITLFIFGGVAQIGHDPDTPGTEFKIAIAGPLSSLFLAGIFFIIGRLFIVLPTISAAALYLSRINFFLAGFNLIPGFPLDGGRVLRAIFWKFGGNFRIATTWAFYIGQVVAIIFLVFGVYQMFTGNVLNGLWIAFIGWFLINAANDGQKQVMVRETLINVTASELMTQDCPKISEEISIRQLLDEYVVGAGYRCFFVTTNGQIEGMLTLTNIKEVKRNHWNTLPVKDVMTPLDNLVSTHPDEDAWMLLRKMDEADVNQIPVVDSGQAIGLVTRKSLLHYVRNCSETRI